MTSQASIEPRTLPAAHPRGLYPPHLFIDPALYKYSRSKFAQHFGCCLLQLGGGGSFMTHNSAWGDLLLMRKVFRTPIFASKWETMRA